MLSLPWPGFSLGTEIPREATEWCSPKTENPLKNISHQVEDPQLELN